MPYNHDKSKMINKPNYVPNQYQFPIFSDINTKEIVDNIRVYDHYTDVNKFDVGNQVYHNPNAPTRFYPTIAQVKMTEKKYEVKCDKTREFLKSDNWQGYQLENRTVLTYEKAIKGYTYAPKPLPYFKVEDDFSYMCWRLEKDGWNFDDSRFARMMKMHCFDIKSDNVFDNWVFDNDKFNKVCKWSNNLESKKRGVINPYACELSNVNNKMPNSSSFTKYASKDIRQPQPPAIMSSSSSKTVKKKSTIEKHSTENNAKKPKSIKEKDSFDMNFDKFFEKYGNLKSESDRTIAELKNDIKEVSDENVKLASAFDKMKTNRDDWKTEALDSREQIKSLKERVRWEREQNKKMTAMMESVRCLSLISIDNFGSKSKSHNDNFQVFGKAKEDGRIYFAIKSEEFEKNHDPKSNDGDFIKCNIEATKIKN